ncbi:MAG: FAD-dependent oxidoreductase [wastewater metagenome]|nr:FAD-dependent oxidoreductase [Candidatus Loosdrechtia aerotolerans]
MLFSPLEKNISVEVAIIGGGIAGMSIAYFLSQQGRKVAVIDDGAIGSGESGRTTAHLTYALDTRYYELENLHGRDGARFAAESHIAAIDTIETIVKEENISCDFKRVDGYLFRSGEDTEKDPLRKELDVLHRIGKKEVALQKEAPLPFSTGMCLHFPHQGQFHPLKYLAGLAEAILRKDGKICTETHVKDFDVSVITTDTNHTVNAYFIVVTTNVPVNDRTRIHTKQAPYRTYVIGARIPKDSIGKSLYWDTGRTEGGLAKPYHYIRTQPLDETYDLLIIGGEDKKTGQNDNSRYERIEAWARNRFPMIRDIPYRWSGQVVNPIDGIGFIGRNPLDKNIYIATGFSGNGMTHGTVAGILITDLIVGKRNPWTDLYDPSRKSILAARGYLEENLNVVKQYTGWLRKGDIPSFHELTPGQGAIMRRGLSKVAVYRDETGTVHEFSAICPHLGCIIQWNFQEKTFDCPCHGSRFTSYGKVINGPSNTDLNKK